MQIGARHGVAHRPADQVAKRYILPLAAGVADIELNLFDRRDRLRNAVVGLFHRGEVGDEHASVEDIAENELAFQRVDTPVIGEAVGDRTPLVVIVDHHGEVNPSFTRPSRISGGSGYSSFSAPPRNRPFAK